MSVTYVPGDRVLVTGTHPMAGKRGRVAGPLEWHVYPVILDRGWYVWARPECLRPDPYVDGDAVRSAL